MDKGQKLAGTLNGEGMCDERGVCVTNWERQYEVESKSHDTNDPNKADSDDAADVDDADGANVAPMSPERIEPRQTSCEKARAG